MEAEGIEIGPSPAEADHIQSFSLPIEELELTVRSYNCLKREGVHTVGELVARTESDLLDIRNFGQKSIDGEGQAARAGSVAQGQPGQLRPVAGRRLRPGHRRGRTMPRSAMKAARISQEPNNSDRTALGAVAHHQNP